MNQAQGNALTTPGTITSSSTPTTAAAANSTTSQNIAESAGNASLHSTDPSDPFCPLQLDADVDWNADSGVTSHKTPHHHWLRNYTPKHVPIKLADHTVIYSAGIVGQLWSSFQ
jgi:hypothetical protein